MKYRIKRQNEFNKVKEQRLKDLKLTGERLWRFTFEYVSPEKKNICLDYLELKNH